jgi:hypothetical protein
VGVESEIADRAGDVESGASGPGGTLPAVATRPRRSWWLVTALAVCAALVIGGTVTHVLDQRNAARDLYRTQLLTTVSRFTDEEQRQIALPVAQRSAPAFGDLASSIGADQGVNGSGTLQVSLGAGSAAQPAQIAFSATVASPYASTTLVVWYISVASHGGIAENQGVCVLGSTLLGRGRTTAPLGLGGGEQLAPCSPQWWAPGPVTATQPRLRLAGIPQENRRGYDDALIRLQSYKR